MLAPLIFAFLPGCGGGFEMSVDFDPDSAIAIADYLAPPDVDFQDAFFVEADLDGQPMLGVLAATIPDACEAYSRFVPVAYESYESMLDMDGGADEDAVLQAWQDALAADFPTGTTIAFFALGVEERSSEAVEQSYTMEWDIATARVSDTQGPQPAGTFVGDLFVVTEGIDVFCLYTGSCDDAANEASNQALYNQWSVSEGTLVVDRFSSGRKLEGTVDMSLVSRWVDAQFGSPAVLGDASASFEVGPCETLDENIFRYWSLL